MKEVKIVQYNILCPKLATTDTFVKTEPKHLDEMYRYNLIWAKISKYVEQEAIICLQEIPESWIGKFSDNFSANGYQILYSLYGNLHNDFMGTGIAYPSNRYKSNNSEIINIGLSLQKEQIKKESTFTQCWLLFITMLGIIFQSFKNWYEKNSFDPLAYAEKKTNRLICMNFTDKMSHKNFTVATYHMPCAFKYPEVMKIHGTQVIAMIDDYLKRNDYDKAVIFAGDFNIRPNTDEYHNLFAQKLLLNSAYLEYNGSEPKYTNRSFTSFSNCEFSDCIDYIFYTKDLFDVSYVLPLSESTEIFYPNEDEPSDHLLLNANFKFKG